MNHKEENVQSWTSMMQTEQAERPKLRSEEEEEKNELFDGQYIFCSNLES